jgi:hypothetical protein
VDHAQLPADITPTEELAWYDVSYTWVRMATVANIKSDKDYKVD